MRRRGLLKAALCWVLLCSSCLAQENETCTSDSCGITECSAGFELEVTIDADSLMISCNACDVDYFKAEAGADACTACPDGLVAQGGATVCTLEEGFWRTSNMLGRYCRTRASLEVYECPNTDACVGGSDVASYCNDGFQGPLCAVCADDYYPSGSFECLACTTANSASTIITIIIFLAVLALFLFLVIKAAEKVQEQVGGAEVDEAANDAAAQSVGTKTSGSTNGVLKFVKKWKDTLVVRFKIIVAHFQVIAAFPQVLDVQWPESFNRYADKMSIFNLDFWGILSQGCYFRSDFLRELIFTTLLPLGIVGVLVGFYYKNSASARGVAAKQAAWDRTTGGVLLTGFFFYIITSTIVLKSFDCQNFDDGTSFLKADYDISCDSRRYDAIFWYGVVMAIIFPVGIPLTYVAVLYSGRNRINPDPENAPLSITLREGDMSIQKTKFLWGTYRPAVYFYEVWECVRKLLLTGLLVYFEEGTASQVVIAILITLAGLRVLAGLRPYLREDENTLAEASLWVTFLTLFAALLIKSDVADDDGYDTVALGVILSIMNAALLALAAFQILWTSSVWFNDNFGGYFEEDRKSHYKQMPGKQRRESAPTTTRTATQPRGMEKPRAMDKPVRPVRPQQARQMHGPHQQASSASRVAQAQPPRPTRPASHGHTADLAASIDAIQPTGTLTSTMPDPQSREHDEGPSRRPSSDGALSAVNRPFGNREPVEMDRPLSRKTADTRYASVI